VTRRAELEIEMGVPWKHRVAPVTPEQVGLVVRDLCRLELATHGTPTGAMLRRAIDAMTAMAQMIDR
jgi:hypothetical protein